VGTTLIEIQGLTAALAANGRVPSTVPAPVATSDVKGIIPAAGTTPTGGSGFTYTHTNGTGLYVFTFATAFQATPDIQLSFAANPVTASVDVINSESASATGFTVRTQDRSGTARDVAFSFTATPIS
jgi:hypothetical protein